MVVEVGVDENRGWHGSLTSAQRLATPPRSHRHVTTPGSSASLALTLHSLARVGHHCGRLSALHAVGQRLLCAPCRRRARRVRPPKATTRAVARVTFRATARASAGYEATRVQGVSGAKFSDPSRPRNFSAHRDPGGDAFIFGTARPWRPRNPTNPEKNHVERARIN